jgi:hypothetical protein
MRRMASLALAVFLTAGVAVAQNSSSAKPGSKTSKTPTALPTPTAEPANPSAYSAPLPHEREGPSDADVGPVLKHFVRASETDDIALTQVPDNAWLKAPEKISIDKRITVPLIHDVQNDGAYAGADNAALRYEISYLNWGAITQTQLLARRGHYFTITWDNDGPKGDFVARFQYREVKSKEIVRTLEQKMPAVAGTTRSYFAIVNNAYLAYGPVVSWRFTILRGDTVVAEAKSFIW